MKKIKRPIYISATVITAGILIALFVLVKQYNKPHTDISASRPDHTITAKMLVEAFKTDEEKANSVYLDKVLQVEGVIRDISTVDGNGVITLDTGDSLEGVICNMNPTENKKVLGLDKGQKIVVKGICTGFLMDVVIVRAVITGKTINS